MAQGEVKGIIPSAALSTDHLDIPQHNYNEELTVKKFHERDDRELLMVKRTERQSITEKEITETVEKLEIEPDMVETEKGKWERSLKPSKEQEVEPDLTKKKIKLLPKKLEEQEVVKLQPFEKPKKAAEGENSRIQGIEPTVKGEKHQRDTIERDQPVETERMVTNDLKQDITDKEFPKQETPKERTAEEKPEGAPMPQKMETEKQQLTNRE